MRLSFIIPLYIILILDLLFGTMFTIMHWPGGINLLFSGVVLEAVFAILTIAEISAAKDTSKTLKIIIIVLYGLTIPLNIYFFLFRGRIFLLFLNLLAGIIYLFSIRPVLVPKKSKLKDIKFDSF